MRIPYPIEIDRTGWYKVNDFKVLHFNYAHQKRLESKNRFYQCLVLDRNPNEKPISLYRSYHQQLGATIPLPVEWLKIESKSKTLIDLVEIKNSVYWFDNEVIRFIKARGEGFFRLLDIWDKDWLTKMTPQMMLKDPRNV
jgi:hypothetical protein